MSWDLPGTLRSLRKQPMIRAAGSARDVGYGPGEIERIIPHREPMRLVDRIDWIDLDNRRLAGTLRLRPEDPVFLGHFPGDPVYPGVLQVEAMGQLGLCLAHFYLRGTTDLDPAARPVPVRALRVHHAQYLTALVPGDVLQLYAEIIEEDGMTATCAGQVVKASRVASLAIQEVYFVE